MRTNNIAKLADFVAMVGRVTAEPVLMVDVVRAWRLPIDLGDDE
jgi:hypothetical protein